MDNLLKPTSAEAEILLRNKDVYLNFGCIAYGKYKDIEALQTLISKECHKVKVRVVYQTVSAKRLKLVKQKETEIT